MTRRDPTRASAALHRRITAWLLVILGFAAATMGLAILGVELFHSVLNRHPAIGTNIGAGVLLFAFGAGLIQTGSVQTSLSVLREMLGEAIPLFRSQRPGGRRATDPKPPTTADSETDDDSRGHVDQ